MTKTSLTVRRMQRSLAGGALLVALLLPAGAAHAQATVFRFFDTTLRPSPPPWRAAFLRIWSAR
jgi:hypothetical protein